MAQNESKPTYKSSLYQMTQATRFSQPAPNMIVRIATTRSRMP
ncbi:MAG: hypothetical protein ABSC77_13455 [Terracidiphilus sp.]|jgi:hypothetical protein